MPEIRLLIVDDHAVVRKGISTLLEDEPGLRIVGEAADGEEALERIRTLQPTIVMLDLTMPGMSGLETARHISSQFPAVRPLIFSMHNNQDYMVSAVEAGAWGFLLKDMGKEEIMRALRAVAGGEKYFPSQISGLIINALMSKNAKPTRPTSKRPVPTGTPTAGITSKLSKKEQQILHFIADGLNSREIAEQLQLSIRTVTNHRANMLRKTKVKNTVELVRLAIEERQF
jgi:DNA-binding NarL/FixJ family response regulator